MRSKYTTIRSQGTAWHLNYAMTPEPQRQSNRMWWRRKCPEPAHAHRANDASHAPHPHRHRPTQYRSHYCLPTGADRAGSRMPDLRYGQFKGSPATGITEQKALSPIRAMQRRKETDRRFHNIVPRPGCSLASARSHEAESRLAARNAPEKPHPAEPGHGCSISEMASEAGIVSSTRGRISHVSPSTAASVAGKSVRASPTSAASSL